VLFPGKASLTDGDDASSEGGGAIEDNEMEEDVSVNEDEEDEEEEERHDNEEAVGPARTASGQIKGSRGRNERVMAPAEVRNTLRLVFQKESELCSLMFGRHGSPLAIQGRIIAPSILADMFFMDVMPVPPTRFRPASKMNGELFENAQNSLLTAVISTTQRIRELNQRCINYAKMEKGEMIMDELSKIEGKRAFEQLLETLIRLQHDVNSFMDSSKNPTLMRQGKLPPPGVKQLLEKKEGLFRKHMMVSIKTSSTADLRVNESIMPLDRSSHQTSISKPTRLVSHQSSPRS
jgi:DNA-directed RNA polymerase I subunit RPA1